MKNSFKYNKDLEITCKFQNAKDRSNVFKLLKEIELAPSNFEGIVIRPGPSGRLYFKKQKCSFKIGEKAEEKFKSLGCLSPC